MQPRVIRAVAVLAIALLPATAGAATRTYTVTSFDRIRLEGPFEVVVQTNRGSSARAEGPDARMLDRVRVEVLGRTLVIRRDRDAIAGGSLRGIRITTSTPALSGAAVLGAGIIRVEQARASRFDISVSGAGGVEIGALQADSVSISATGAGRAKLAGRAQQVRALVQGAGTIDGGALTAADVRVTTAGAGDITLAASRSATVNATGSGAVTILGHPACTVAAEGTVEVLCEGPARR